MKMARLQYRFENNEAVGVDVGFEDWTNEDVQYNITVKLNADEADLSMSTPSQLAEAARQKVAQLVADGN